MKLLVRRVGEHDPNPLPAYATVGSAGLDLYSTQHVVLEQGERAKVPTGIAVAVPAGHAGLICSRSGRAWNEGLIVAHGVGTIDEDYRGEVAVLVRNVDDDPLTIEPGERIAQMLIVPVVRVEIEEVGGLPATERGASGFGSTGSRQPGTQEPARGPKLSKRQLALTPAQRKALGLLAVGDCLTAVNSPYSSQYGHIQGPVAKALVVRGLALCHYPNRAIGPQVVGITDLGRSVLVSQKGRK